MRHPQILEFYPLDLDDNTIADESVLHKPSGNAKPLTFFHNDILRLHIHKSFLKEFGDDFYSKVAHVSLYGKTSCSASNAILRQVGTISPLESEKYHEIVLMFRSIPTGWAQFSLLRENGNEAFGTFKEQHATKAEYIQAVADWFESYPYTPIVADVDGDYLRLRVYADPKAINSISAGQYYTQSGNPSAISKNWQILGEKLSVGIGSVGAFNTNTPSIKATLINSNVTIPATDIVTLNIGSDIQEGNIFKFGEKSYKASNFDTPESIRSYFLNGAIQYSVQNTESYAVTVDLGYSTFQNTNIATISALYDSTLSGKDRYLVSADNVVSGNIITVIENGKATKSYTVQDGDTSSTVEAFFNSTGGFLSVNEGVNVEMAFAQGERQIENTNSPYIEIEIVRSLAAQNVDEYSVYVGSSVRAGNVFTLGNETVTATDSDTFDTIQTKLGLENGKLYQVPTGTTFKCTAAKGSPYGADNIPDIEIIQQPQIKKSEFFKMDVIFEGCEDYVGDFQLVFGGKDGSFSLYNPSMSYIAISQYFRLLPEDQKTGVVVSFRDTGKAFGFDYNDQEDFQQIRIPAQVYDYGVETVEEKSRDVNGKEHTGKVEITQRANFGASLLANNQALALMLGLKHKQVYIDGRLAEISDAEIIPANPRMGNVTGVVKFKDHNWTNHNNSSGFLLSHLESSRIKNNDSLNIFLVILKNAYFRNVLSEDFDTMVQPMECYPEVYISGTMEEQNPLTVTGENSQYQEIDPMAFFSNGYCLLQIFENGYKIVEEYVRKGHRNRLSNVVRFEPSKTYEFKTIQTYAELESYVKVTDESYLGIDIEDYKSVTYTNESI